MKYTKAYLAKKWPQFKMSKMTLLEGKMISGINLVKLQKPHKTRTNTVEK
jgi:hypothetical protein